MVADQVVGLLMIGWALGIATVSLLNWLDRRAANAVERTMREDMEGTK